jgi:di/tricarboxylate transporter
MNAQSWSLAAILIITLVLFMWGRYKPEVIALGALLLCTLLDIIPVESTFIGFGHPAVITVAAVLVLSQALAAAGLVELATRPLSRLIKYPVLLLAGMTLIVAALSGFINNVGALALMMPIAIGLARQSGKPPSMFLMPLAFGSLLGGMTTLIGTPPNMIVSGFRAKAGGEPFGLFAFAPVGVCVAAAGILTIVLAWRLIPRRESQVNSEDLVKVGPYLTEAIVTEKSSAVGQTLRDLKPNEVQILAIIRGDRRITAPSAFMHIREGDLLVMMGESEAIEKFTAAKGLAMEVQEEDLKAELLESEEIGLAEAVLMPHSHLIGKTAIETRMRDRHGMNLLGIAREGARIGTRLANTRFRAGDVLLVQGNRADIYAELADLGCLPLAERTIGLAQTKRRWQALAIFLGAIAIVATGLVAAPVSFATAALLMVLTGVLTLRRAYAAIDWQVLILLAAMLPVGLAIESTGLASLIANATMSLSTYVPLWGVLAIVMVVTMFLSDIVNNAAAAVMMCPIAIGVATGLNASPDPFLLAVAIGASCAFLTPIGHQSNLLVMGPGGYRFGDYWRLGILLEAVIVVVSIPALLFFWPPV